MMIVTVSDMQPVPCAQQHTKTLKRDHPVFTTVPREHTHPRVSVTYIPQVVFLFPLHRRGNWGHTTEKGVHCKGSRTQAARPWVSAHYKPKG